MTVPEMWLVLPVGFDPRGYFLGGFSLFELSFNRKLFGLFHLYNIDHLLLSGKDLYVPSAAVAVLCSTDIVSFLQALVIKMKLY